MPKPRTFTQIVGNLGVAQGHPVSIGDKPSLSVIYNPGGGGYSPNLVFELNTGVHVTIFQSSWDGTSSIPDETGGTTKVGPYCLHLTAVTSDGTKRWFRRFKGTWEWTTDYGTPEEKVVKAFDIFFQDHGAISA